MNADQVRRFLSSDTGNLIAIRAGTRTLRLKIAPYFTELPVNTYSPSVYYCETYLRKLARLLLNS